IPLRPLATPVPRRWRPGPHRVRAARQSRGAGRDRRGHAGRHDDQRCVLERDRRLDSMSLTAALVIGAGVAATVVDVRRRRVPNVLTMGVASAGLVLAMAGFGTVTIGGALGGLALGLALLLPAHVFGATGAGDVKLLAAFG